MSALDWSMWLRSGAVTGPPVNRHPRVVRIGAMAYPVRLNRLVFVQIADTTRSADVG